MFLQACLNGDRTPDDHPRCPVSPAELAADAESAARAGAVDLHIHARNPAGAESLEAADVAAAVRAVSAAVDLPVGVSTGAWFAPDPDARVRAIWSWEVLPAHASVNLHEEGAVDVCLALLARGVDIEAGVWTPAAAEVLVAAGLVDRCLRILIEPMDPDIDAAVRTGAETEAVLDAGGCTRPRLLHGTDATTWPLLDRAARLGHQIRIGLEDTLSRPDGAVARDNAELIQLARERVGAADRPE